MTARTRTAAAVLKILQVLFYLAFVFLWFKDNYLKFRPISVSPWIPLAGLAASAAPWLLVVPCDTPHLPPDLGARLLAAALAADAPLAVAADADRVHHTCFLARSELAPALAAYLADGGRAVRGWHATLPHALARFDAAGFVNLNAASDAGR